MRLTNFVLERVKKYHVEGRDAALSSLSHDYISHERLHVDSVVDDIGATLLHHCAAAALPECKAMLVSAGAALNSKRTGLPEKQSSVEFFLRDPFAMGTPKEIIGKQLQKLLANRSNRLNEGGRSSRPMFQPKQCRVLTETDSAFIHTRLEVQRALEGG